MNVPTISIELDRAALASLRKIASGRGYTIGRGKNPHMGSVRKLLLAIARGDLVVAPPADAKTE